MVSVDAKHDVYFNTPSPFLISLVVSVDVKHHMFTCNASSKLRSCVKVEVAVLGSPNLLSPVVSVAVKQH